MDNIFSVAGNISTPLMLAGFFAAIFFFIVRQIIRKNIFPELTRQLSGDIIRLLIQRLFWLALIAMILGFVGFVIYPNPIDSEKGELINLDTSAGKFEAFFQSKVSKEDLREKIQNNKNALSEYFRTENYKDILIFENKKINDIKYDLIVYFHNDAMNQMGRSLLFINFFDVSPESIDWNLIDQNWDKVSKNLIWDNIKISLERTNGFRYSLERSTPLGLEKPRVYYIQLTGRRNELNQFDIASMPPRRIKDSTNAFYRIVGTYDFMIEKFSPLIQ